MFTGHSVSFLRHPGNFGSAFPPIEEGLAMPRWPVRLQRGVESSVNERQQRRAAMTDLSEILE